MMPTITTGLQFLLRIAQAYTAMMTLPSYSTGFVPPLHFSKARTSITVGELRQFIDGRSDLAMERQNGGILVSAVTPSNSPNMRARTERLFCIRNTDDTAGINSNYITILRERFRSTHNNHSVFETNRAFIAYLLSTIEN